jgi:mRNA-degrading endonuclease toxin of MazEF toxin-antitoxin module
MKRGSVYWVNLEPSNPPEFGKVRPGLIISNTEHNIRIPTVVIVPLSTRAPEIWPLRLAVPLSKGKESFAVLPGIRQVNKTRLYEMIALLPQSFLLELDEALRIYLSE